MYNSNLIATSDTRLTLERDGHQETVALYSQEGLETVAALWVKLCAQYKLMYEPTWLGVPIIQLPTDVILLQELIWKLRPDYIVECGFAHGGSAIFYASLCELMGKGTVIGVDIEVRKYNRLAVESHPLGKRIQIVERSSVDGETIDEVRRVVSGAKTVLVLLDSNHTREHVLREMELYHELVTGGSYLVVMDGAQAHVWDTPRGKPEWRESNPLQAIAAFLETHGDFADDPRYTRLHVTCCPGGFLRRRENPGCR